MGNSLKELKNERDRLNKEIERREAEDRWIAGGRKRCSHCGGRLDLPASIAREECLVCTLL